MTVTTYLFRNKHNWVHESLRYIIAKWDDIFPEEERSYFHAPAFFKKYLVKDKEV